MQATDHLITAQEVIDNAPADLHSDVQQRCKFIIPKEDALFRCFGQRFYRALLEDRVVYRHELEAESFPGEAVFYKSFREKTDYLVGDYVRHFDLIYRVIRPDVKSGAATPPNPLFFERAKKFKTPANNFLWYRYLQQIIAFAVNHAGVFYRAVKDTNKGVVQNYTESSTKPVTLGMLQALKKEVNNDTLEIIENMEDYILQNRGSFPLYEGNIKAADCGPGGSCNSNKRRKRNFGFYFGKR